MSSFLTIFSSNQPQVQKKQLFEQSKFYELASKLEKEIYTHFNLFPKIFNVEIKLKNFQESQYIHTVNLSKPSLQEKDTKTLVLLHGYGNTSLSYYKIINNLSHKYDTYAIDLPGMGLSSRPKYEIKEVNETIDYFVESIEMWRQKMEKEKITLVGHSFGGYMAFNYALKYPQNVDNLVLLSPMGGTRRTDEEVKQFHSQILEGAGFMKKFFFRYFTNIWQNKKTLHDITNTWYFPTSTLLNKYISNRLQVDQSIKEKWLSYTENFCKLPKSSDESIFYLLRFPMMAAFYSLEEILDHHLKQNANFSKFPFQTHFLYGDQDWMCDVGAKNIVYQKKINAHFHKIPKGDHQMVFLNSQDVSDYILKNI